ncbi:MAG: pyruvate, phosphate dikinase, partial [Actinobacteria bacterium]|nr:pyruvate, phosphate dikinase [Actinomycetota bacterium]
AILRAAAHGNLKVMFPMVSDVEELVSARRFLAECREELESEGTGTGPVEAGVMVETPAAALCAEELARAADFFSIGTNDLTQMTFGFSRDDVEGRMMTAYLEQGLLKRNPFDTLDQAGVGELVEVAVARGREAAPGIKLGVCGEHGGDPQSIDFFYRAGLDYVSCSPFRVPIARLASAQAVLGAGAESTA